MRYVLSLLAAVCIATFAIISARAPAAQAAFHCMRIHAVMAGFNGNGNIQYVELRMDLGGQTFLGGHTLKFYSGDPAVAANLKATFTFPSGVGNGNLGDSILVATSEFNSAVTGGAADFTFIATGPSTNTVASNGGDALHPIQAPNGLVHFAQGSDNCDADFVAGPGESDSLGYGTTPAYFTAAASALPSPGTNHVLRLNNLNQTPANNSTEYDTLNTVSTTTFSAAGNLSDKSTPRNNGETVLAFPQTGPVGGVSQDAQGLPAADATSSGGGGGPGWWVYAAGSAAAFAATASAWWIRRHRRQTA